VGRLQIDNHTSENGAKILSYFRAVSNAVIAEACWVQLTARGASFMKIHTCFLFGHALLISSTQEASCLLDDALSGMDSQS